MHNMMQDVRQSSITSMPKTNVVCVLYCHRDTVTVMSSVTLDEPSSI